MKAISIILCVFLTALLVYSHSVRITGFKYQKAAWMAERRGLKKQMLVYALKGVEANPYNLMMRGFVAVSLLRNRKVEPGLKHLEVMLKYCPNNINALFNLAICNAVMKDHERYRETIKRIKLINPVYVKNGDLHMPKKRKI